MDNPVYKTKGIILKKSDLNDTDRLLTVYTEKFGKILARAKGIGKKESKLKSLIEPFNIYEFSLAKSKSIDVLAGSWPIKEFIYLRQNLENLSLAIYFSELVDKLIVAPERDDKIWALLIRAFEVLDRFSLSHPSLISRIGEKNPPQPSLKGGSSPPLGGVRGDFDKLKSAFEERLLGYLGHPNFKMRDKTTEREKLDYLQSLAGEEIIAGKFLVRLNQP